MSRKMLTTEATRYCNARGRKVSPRTLQKYRLKGQDDPGEHGPRFLRDPATGWAYYLEADLLIWCEEFDRRLVERGPTPQPPKLTDAAGARMGRQTGNAAR